MRVSRLIPLVLTGLLGACATGPRAPADTPVAAAETVAAKVRVTVTRDGSGWRADYVLGRDAPAWAFYRSSRLLKTREPWRPRDWAVVTSGVVLESIGDLDVLRAADGGNVPREFSIRLTPRGGNLEADYPVLVFTDGSVALFAGAFDVFALDRSDAASLSLAEVTALQSEGANAHVTWQDRNGPVLVQGERVKSATTEDGNTYVLFGEARIKESARVVTVVDPQLPGWITASIEGYSPQVVDHYAARLGKGQTDRPMVMASWYGPSRDIVSYGGSVLPGLIVMSFEGQELLSASDTVLSGVSWFIAHEVAHFWLGQTVRTETQDESWITEGGADLMAVRAAKALDPSFDDTGFLQTELDDCVALGTKPVAGAGRRGEHRAYYACGAVLALAAEGLQRRATGGDWFDALKSMIDAHRATGVLTRAAWLAHLTTLGAPEALTVEIDRFLSAGSKDPKAFVRSLFDRTGIAYRMDKGRVVLVDPGA